MQQNYGPEGLVLRLADVANRVPVGLSVVVGVTLIVASGSRGSIGLAGDLMLVPAFCFCSLGIARSRQSRAAGRKFRGGRPFVRA
jgi:hypothetical protein